MSILHQLIGWLMPGGAAVRNKGAAPYQVTSAISPQENYAGYTQLPNLGDQGSMGDYTPDPNRLHAPFQIERGQNKLINQGGVHWFDAGDETIIEIPDQALQQYFNQGKEVAAIPQYVPANGVFSPTAMYQRGYFQSYVPEFGERLPIVATAPVQLLSHPIAVRSMPPEQDKRANLSGARAHAPKKGV